MGLKIYTYANPYEIRRESYWNEIKDCAHFCVSQTMVNGLEDIYPSLKDGGYLTTIRILINTLYSDWENENKRVKQIMEVDNAINALAFDGDESGNAARSLEHNINSLVKCIRLFRELGLGADSFDVSGLNTDQKYLIDIYKYICGREKTSFEFKRTSQADIIDEKILEALKTRHKDFPYDNLDRSTVVIHGIHQFTPAMLCAVEDISRSKNVILLFNYQKQYEAVYRTWTNIYSLFEKEIKYSAEPEFKPVSLMVDSYPCNTLADTIGTLSNGKLEVKSGVLDKLEIIEFENTTEFAGYCARLFENACKVHKSSGSYSVLYDMSEQLYSASGKVNDILRAYFPEQFGERHFLDYPFGHFFAAAVEMWDNENQCVKVEDTALIKNCFESGIIKEKVPGELLNTFNTVEPYVEEEHTLDGIIGSLKKLRKYVSPSDKKLRRIGYLSISREKLDELRTALEEIKRIVIGFFSDFSSGGDNFNRFYRRIRDFIANRTQDMEYLDDKMKKVVARLLARMDKIDLPDTGTFACLKRTMSFYLSQDDSPRRGAKWIVRDFDQIDGDILRSAKQKADRTCYHFCCLSDNDICAAKDERLPWPLDINFFEYSHEPLEQNYQIFLKSKMEFKNFKRYALLYGLEFNRIGCKLSYVKTENRKDNELYHLIKMLGIKVRKYRSDAVNSYVPHLKYGEPNGEPYPKDNEEIDKIKYCICPHRFALEGAVQGETVFRERFHAIHYMRVMLESAIRTDNAGRQLSDNELRNIIISEYRALDDKFKISNEYEKSQIISAVYAAYKKDSGKKCSITKPSDIDKLKDDFLLTEKLDGFVKEAAGINLDEVINNDGEKYRIKTGTYCTYCSSQDVCLYKQQK